MKKIFVLLTCLFVLAPSVCFAKKIKKPAEEEIVNAEPAKKKKKISSLLDGPSAEDDSSTQKKSKASKQKTPKKETVKKEAAEKSKAKKQSAKKESAKKTPEKPEKKSRKKASKIQDAPVIDAPVEEPLVETPFKVIKKGGGNTILERDIVRLQTVTEGGSMMFFVNRGKDSWLPVIEKRDLGDSTYLSLFVDGNEYRLNRSNIVSYIYEIYENSIAVVYTVKNLAEVRVVYELAPVEIEGQGEYCESIRVLYEVKNISKATHEIGLKAVYNTILGEARPAHFFVPPKKAIGSEYSFIPTEELDRITSSDGRFAVEFELVGEGIVPPARAAMANKDIVEDSSLDGNFLDRRSFTSVLSYNNSCVALIWQKEMLGQDKTRSVCYKINFSNTDFQDRVRIVTVPVPVPVEPAVKEEEPVEEQVAPVVEPPAQEERPTYGFETEREYLDPQKVNAAYIQQLIDQINALERNDPSLNREKILQLQSEINRVLEILRSRR